MHLGILRDVRLTQGLLIVFKLHVEIFIGGWLDRTESRSLDNFETREDRGVAGATWKFIGNFRGIIHERVDLRPGIRDAKVV